MKYEIKNRFTNNVIFCGDFESMKECVESAVSAGASLYGAILDGANLDRANLYRANLYRANLDGANLYRANLDGANLDGANLDRANLDGANLDRAKIIGEDSLIEVEKMKVFSGIYRYTGKAIIAKDGSKYIHLGCHKKKAEFWDVEENFWNNKSEFPDDPKSLPTQERKLCLKTMQEWLKIAEECK